MNSNFKDRLFEMEVSPPEQVWERLSLSLDEINADNKIAAKLYNTENTEVPFIWEEIKTILNTGESAFPQKRGIVINFKRLAVAAVFVGLILSAWLLFFNPKQKKSDIAETETKTLRDKEKANIPELSDTNNPEPNSQSIASNKEVVNKIPDQNIGISNAKTKSEIAPAFTIGRSSKIFLTEKPGNKVFNRPIDDLSIVASNGNYMTMVNTNGRIVKIPNHLAYLAPRLQDKPINEDLHEIMFGEGAYWNDKLNNWRQKLATSPVSSGDIFSNMIDLLKTMQATENDQDGMGR